MPGLQPPERYPVHPFEFAPFSIENTSLPSKPLADYVRPDACAVVCLLTHSAVRQLVAMPARMDTTSV